MGLNRLILIGSIVAAAAGFVMAAPPKQKDKPAAPPPPVDKNDAVRKSAGMTPTKEWDLKPLISGDVGWVSADGKFAHVGGVAEIGGKKVFESYLVDLSTGKLKPLLSKVTAIKGLSGVGPLLAISPNGKWAGISGLMPTDFFLINLDTLAGKKVMEGAYNPVWVGDHVIVAKSGNKDHFSIDPESGKATEIKFKGNILAVNPDGKSFYAYAPGAGVSSDASVHGGDGKEIYAVETANVGSPYYSPSGKLLALDSSNGLGRTTIVDAATGKVSWTQEKLYMIRGVTDDGDLLKPEGIGTTTLFVMGKDLVYKQKIATTKGATLNTSTGFYAIIAGDGSCKLARFDLGKGKD